jgi:biotin carboxylase
MTLMMLGASRSQLPGILRAKTMGHRVITCDYIENAIGHQYSDQQLYVSTFDVEGVVAAASALELHGIMTMATDQPVYTAAVVANRLGLPSPLFLTTALSVTNKQTMKAVFDRYQIPCVASILYEKGIHEAVLDTIDYPVVIKPVDSQGQRGVFYVESSDQVRNLYREVIKHSRQRQILVEQYYPHDEITVSGWVQDSQLTILTVTDRVTFKDRKAIGICLAHNYPSKHLKAYQEEIEALTQQIVKAFDIQNGPIYFQYFLGAEGLKVNEVACRIGGAFESSFIPLVTEFDILERTIESALGTDTDTDTDTDTAYLQTAHKPTRAKHLSVQLFFSEPCIIASQSTEEGLLTLEGVVEVGLYKNVGDVIKPLENATSRVGHAILVADTKEALELRLDQFYEALKILDHNGISHVIHGHRGI